MNYDSDPMKAIYAIANNERSAYLYIMQTPDGISESGGKYQLKLGVTSDIQQRSMQLGMDPLLVSKAFRRADVWKMESQLKQFIEDNISSLNGEYFVATAEQVESIRSEEQFNFPVDVEVCESRRDWSRVDSPYILDTRRVKPLSEAEIARAEKLKKIFNDRKFTHGVTKDGRVCNHVDSRIADSSVNIEPGHGYRVIYMTFVCGECGHRFRRLDILEPVGTYYVDDLPPSYDE